VKKSSAAEWEVLERHFAHHAKLMDRFKSTKRRAVRGMWKKQTNERGEPLSPFEREALIERYCDLFGVWPQ